MKVNDKTDAYIETLLTLTSYHLTPLLCLNMRAIPLSKNHLSSLLCLNILVGYNRWIKHACIDPGPLGDVLCLCPLQLNKHALHSTPPIIGQEVGDWSRLIGSGS